MKPINKHVSALILKTKMKLAEKGVIILAERVNKEKNIYRVYCPKCRTWHIEYLSGLPENGHFHLPCGMVLFLLNSQIKEKRLRYIEADKVMR